MSTGRWTFLIDEWCHYLRAVRGRAPATVARYRQVVERLAGAVGGDLAAVRHEDLERHLRDLYTAGAAPSTMAAAVAAVRGFFDYACARQEVAASPAARLQGPSRRYQQEAPHLTVPEVRRLVFGGRPGMLPSDPLAARDRVLLAVAYVDGLRVSEPGRLRVEDMAWDPEAQLYSVLVRGAKWSDRDQRMVVAQPMVSRMLGAYLELRRRRWPDSPWLFPNYRGGRLSRRSSSRIFEAALAKAEVEPRGRRLTFHVLRHSIATHLWQRGMPEKAVGLWLRHRDRRSTDRYVHVQDERLVRMWRKRDPLTPRREAVPDVHALGRALAGGVAEALQVH